MKNSPTKKELKGLHKLKKVSWPFFALVGIILFLFLYLFVLPLIIQDYCQNKAFKEAKNYTEFLINPPQDLVEAYKHNPDVIDENSQPTPYYVELLLCRLKLSGKLYSFFNHYNEN